MENRYGARGRGATSRTKGRTPHGPPMRLEYRKALFAQKVDELPEVRPRSWKLMALIQSGHSTSDVLVEQLSSELHRTTIFVLLAELVEMGLLAFRRAADDVGPPKRDFKLTAKGERCLDSYVMYLLDLQKKGPTVNPAKNAAVGSTKDATALKAAPKSTNKPMKRLPKGANEKSLLSA